METPSTTFSRGSLRCLRGARRARRRSADRWRCCSAFRSGCQGSRSRACRARSASCAIAVAIVLACSRDARERRAALAAVAAGVFSCDHRCSRFVMSLGPDDPTRWAAPRGDDEPVRRCSTTLRAGLRRRARARALRDDRDARPRGARRRSASRRLDARHRTRAGLVAASLIADRSARGADCRSTRTRPTTNSRARAAAAVGGARSGAPAVYRFVCAAAGRPRSSSSCRSASRRSTCATCSTRRCTGGGWSTATAAARRCTTRC